MTNKLHRVLVKAWIQKDDKFLLANIAGTEKHMAGAWSLPGGNVEKSEEEFIIEKTLKEEIQEEVGLVIEDHVLLVYNNGFMRTADNSHVVNFTFLCKWKSGEAKALEDTVEVKWFTLDELDYLKDKPEFLDREIKNLKKYLNV